MADFISLCRKHEKGEARHETKAIGPIKEGLAVHRFRGEARIQVAVFVAGLGASAGGLEALGSFFDAMPPDSGLAFVVIQHLSPNHKSMMAELLARNTRMPVRQAEDGMTALANHVYLIPPKKCLTIFNGKLLITEWNGDRVPTCRSTLSFAHSPRIAASGRSPSRFPARAAMGRAAFGRSRRRAGW